MILLKKQLGSSAINLVASAGLLTASVGAGTYINHNIEVRESSSFDAKLIAEYTAAVRAKIAHEGSSMVDATYTNHKWLQDSTCDGGIATKNFLRCDFPLMTDLGFTFVTDIDVTGTPLDRTVNATTQFGTTSNLGKPRLDIAARVAKLANGENVDDGTPLTSVSYGISVDPEDATLKASISNIRKAESWLRTDGSVPITGNFDWNGNDLSNVGELSASSANITSLTGTDLIFETAGIQTINSTDITTQNIEVINNANVGGNVTVGGEINATTLNSTQSNIENLNVTNLATIENIVSAGNTILNNLTVTGDSTLKNLLVTDNSIFEGLVTFDGDLISNGTFINNGDVVNNGNTIFNGDTIYNGDTIFSGDVEVEGDLTVPNIIVTDDHRFRRDLYVEGDTYLEQELTVDGISTFKEDVTFRKNINVKGETKLEGATTVLDDLNVDGDIKTDSKLYVEGQSIFNNDATFNDHVVFDRTVTVNGLITGDKLDIDTKTQFLDDTTFEGKNTFNNDSTFNDTVTIKDDLSVEGKALLATLSVTGIVDFESDLSVNGNLDIKKGLDVRGDSRVRGNAIFDQGISVAGVANFGDDVNISSDLKVESDTVLNRLTVEGISEFQRDVTMSRNLLVSGEVTFEKDLFVDGGIYVEGESRFDSEVDLNAGAIIDLLLKVNGFSEFSDLASFKDDINVAGTVFAGKGNFDSTLYVEGASTFDSFVTMNRTLEVIKDVTIGGTAEVDGDFYVEGYSRFEDEVDMKNTLTVSGEVKFKDFASFSKDVTISGKLLANGIESEDDIFVSGDVEAEKYVFSETSRINSNCGDKYAISVTDDGEFLSCIEGKYSFMNKGEIKTEYVEYSLSEATEFKGGKVIIGNHNNCQFKSENNAAGDSRYLQTGWTSPAVTDMEFDDDNGRTNFYIPFKVRSLYPSGSVWVYDYLPSIYTRLGSDRPRRQTVRNNDEILCTDYTVI